MRPFPQQKVSVVRISADFAKVHRAGLSRRGEIFLVFLARAELAAEIPGLEKLRFAAQPAVEQPGAGRSGDGPGRGGGNGVCAAGGGGRFFFSVNSVGDSKNQGARGQRLRKWFHERMMILTPVGSGPDQVEDI